ncbi:MAG: DoxX family membrane protein [Pseudonocardiaceae bacterium]|nr:DoxX family membrane protein [Pseudonocardiaceae bacterium]
MSQQGDPRRGDPDPLIGSGAQQTSVLSDSGAVDGTRRPARPVWNSGADLGLLVLRLVLGGTFVAHGCQKLFGLFGGPGVGGFADVLAGYGYRATEALAWVTGATELVGGALVVLGLFTPLAAAGLLGIMVNAIALKWGNGFFAAPGGGFELELALAAMSAALVLGGPGRAALDKGRSWFRHPVATGWICLLIGIGVGLLFFLLLRT